MTHGGGGGVKIGQKSVTYYLNGPLLRDVKLFWSRFAEFQEVMKRRQKSKKGEKQKLIQLDFQISTKSDSDDNDDSDDGTQHRNKPAPVGKFGSEFHQQYV